MKIFPKLNPGEAMLTTTLLTPAIIISAAGVQWRTPPSLHQTPGSSQRPAYYFDKNKSSMPVKRGRRVQTERVTIMQEMDWLSHQHQEANKARCVLVQQQSAQNPDPNGQVWVAKKSTKTCEKS
eukprot:scaffold631894_cov71-Attheya_sp.AAC.1